LALAQLSGLIKMLGTYFSTFKKTYLAALTNTRVRDTAEVSCRARAIG